MYKTLTWHVELKKNKTQIDAMVHKLYNLSDEEIKIVEGNK